jgi:hypothetical protein
VARKRGVIVDVLADGLTEGDAFDLEIRTISRIGADMLVNHTSGGEGHTGKPAPNRRKVECSNGMVFDSCLDAQAWLRDNGYPRASSSSISACCKGKIHYCHGHTWRYFGSEKSLSFKTKSERMTGSIGRPVIDGFGVEWPSATAAARHYNLCSVGISKACRTGCKYKGRAWKYK